MQILPLEIPLDPYVGRLVTIDVQIGPSSFRCLFDTGGGKTFIIPDVARRLGCNPSGRVVSFRMNGDIVESQNCHDLSLSLGGLTFHQGTLGVWDINSVLPDDLPRLDGILSLDAFKGQPFTLDLASRKLVLESQESLSQRTASMTPLKNRIATGMDGSDLDVFLYGEMETQGWFLFDSGNLEAVIVSPHMAAGQGNNTPESSDTWEAALALQNLPPATARFRTKKIIYDGALSEAFLRKWVFSFDLIHQAVWAAPSELD